MKLEKAAPFYFFRESDELENIFTIRGAVLYGNRR